MIRWNGMDILETLEELVDPRHTLLLMWDFAENVAGNAFNVKTMTDQAAKLLDAARARNVPVLYSVQNNMHLVGDTGAPTVCMRMKRQNRPVAEILRVPAPAGRSPVPRIMAAVKPREDEIVFEKFSPNAFLGTCFEWWLRKFATKTIVLTGVNVATGISGTAREAINLGYYAVVVRDCVGTGSKEDYDVALASMERLFDVVTADDIIDVWKRAPGRA
jgi:nicotinamidase-related amidase